MRNSSIKSKFSISYRTLIAIASISITCMNNACSQKVIRTATLQQQKVTVDGAAKEYPSFQFYDKESKIMYNISNDDSSLYLVLKLHDEAMQQKIMVAGLELSIDTAKKPTRQFYINYPLEGGRPPMANPTDNQQYNPQKSSKLSTMRNHFKMSKTEVKLKGFKGVPAGIQTINSSSIMISVDWDSLGTMYWEAQIPLSTFYKPVITSADSAKTFVLTLNINALQVPDKQQGGGQQAGPPPGGGGMGGMNGGGQGGGQGRPGGQPSADMQTMSVKNNFSIKFKLNTTPK